MLGPPSSTAIAAGKDARHGSACDQQIIIQHRNRIDSCSIVGGNDGPSVPLVAGCPNDIAWLPSNPDVITAAANIRERKECMIGGVAGQTQTFPSNGIVRAI